MIFPGSFVLDFVLVAMEALKLVNTHARVHRQGCGVHGECQDEWKLKAKHPQSVAVGCHQQDACKDHVR